MNLGGKKEEPIVISLPVISSRKIFMGIFSWGSLFPNFHCMFIYHSSKVKKQKMCINTWMNTQIVSHQYNRILSAVERYRHVAQTLVWKNLLISVLNEKALPKENHVLWFQGHKNRTVRNKLQHQKTDQLLPGDKNLLEIRGT